MILVPNLFCAKAERNAVASLEFDCSHVIGNSVCAAALRVCADRYLRV
jgi:hypothetical protein